MKSLSDTHVSRVKLGESIKAFNDIFIHFILHFIVFYLVCWPKIHQISFFFLLIMAFSHKNIHLPFLELTVATPFVVIRMLFCPFGWIHRCWMTVVFCPHPLESFKFDFLLKCDDVMMKSSKKKDTKLELILMNCVIFLSNNTQIIA